MTHRYHDATVRQHQAHDPHQPLTGSDSASPLPRHAHRVITTTTAAASQVNRRHR